MRKLSVLTFVVAWCLVGLTSLAYASGPVEWSYEGDTVLETTTETPATLPQSGGETAPISTGLILIIIGFVIFLSGLILRRRLSIRKDS